MRVQTSSSYREILSREKAILENPQIFQNCEIINNNSADDAQSNAERIQNRLPQNRYKENPWNL